MVVFDEYETRLMRLRFGNAPGPVTRVERAPRPSPLCLKLRMMGRRQRSEMMRMMVPHRSGPMISRVA